MLDQKTVDLLLVYTMAPARLPDEHLIGIRTHLLKQAGMNQPVVDDSICSSQKLESFHGEQVRVSRSRSYEVNDSAFYWPSH
jgi:hypothetical protein